MRQLLYTLHGFPGYDIQTRRDIQSTMDIEQFHVTEQCLFSAILAIYIMLRDELTQLTSHSKTVTGFRCPRACRIRKYQFENR
jgi:hypothetical protein